MTTLVKPTSIRELSEGVKNGDLSPVEIVE